MTKKKRVRSDWPVWGVVILALLAAYFGAYTRFVERLGTDTIVLGENVRRTEYVPGYYAGNDPIDEALEFFFYPAHAVDRIVRKSYWKTVVEPRRHKSTRRSGFEGAEATSDGDTPK